MPVTKSFSPVSVVIPAYNEEAVIARCLTSLMAGAAEGELELVVVCNGCRDRTGEVARQFAPTAAVLETPVASKVAALNLGDEHSHYFPRFYVDADVELPIEVLRSVASVLRRGDVQCAAPQPRFDLAGRSWAVRAFYRIWQGIPYHSEQMVGSGVYALSEEGRARFGAFPDLTADDQFVQQLFDISERKAVPGAYFVVHAPRSLQGLLSMRARAYRGNLELARSGLARHGPPPSGASSTLRAALQPANVPAVVLYAGVNLVAKGLARRRRRPIWERDDSARSSSARPHERAQAGRAGQEEPVVASVCYVTSHYPAVSHTFVLREVVGVRASGLRVCTVSVHRAEPGHLLAEIDNQEAARTWSVFPLDKKLFFFTHARAVAGHPGAYFRTLAHALRSSPPGLRGRLWQLLYFAEAVLLWDHAEREDVSHFHAHLANVAADISWLACAFGRHVDPSKGWRWSFTMHGPTEFYAVERFNLARKIAEADAVICISEFAKSQLMYLSAPSQWGKLRVVHCGADLERYRYLPPPSHSFVSVLCVCRLVPEKGVDLLVEAIAALRAVGNDVRLVLVGPGPLEGAIRRKMSELDLEGYVELTGAVGQDEMAAYYAAADLFCLPSFAEGVPVVMMEAMATGRPVIASRIAGVPELIEDGSTGLLIAPGSLDELIAALGALIASPDLRTRLGRAGRVKVEEAFDAQLNAAQLAEVFKQPPFVADGFS